MTMSATKKMQTPAAAHSCYYWDIETSGLDWKECIISCIGFMGPNGIRVFAGDEKLLLTQFNEYVQKELKPALEANSRHVSFNGARFDVPFIVGRAKHHAINDLASFFESPVFVSQHLDLYEVALPLKGKLGLYSLKKKDLVYNLGAYEPKTSTGLDCALKAKAIQEGRAGFDDLVDILMHNSVDLSSTFQLHKRFVHEGWCQ